MPESSRESALLNGNLFTRDFLLEGIRETAAWAALEEASVEAKRDTLESLFTGLAGLKNPTEAETEKELIYPVLQTVGWSDLSVQQNLSASAREDVPDALLFGSAEAKAKAAPLSPWQRFQHGLCVVEAKRWNRVLDREEARRKAEEGVPSTQMLRYLRRVGDVTEGHLRWGILTNGRHWRLYFSGALSVAEDFLEIDLGKALGRPGCDLDLLDKRPEAFADDAAWRAHALKLFVLLFGRAAFLPDHRSESFHQLALREGKQWEARVARDLSDTVFASVFPTLGQALAAADGRSGDALDSAYLAELREGALILLYRLLFVLYAEDRNLLPDESGPYADIRSRSSGPRSPSASCAAAASQTGCGATGRGSRASSTPSPMATTRWASRLTMAACLIPARRRSWPGCNSRTPSWRRSSSASRTSTCATGELRNTSTTATSRCSSSARSMSASSNMG